MNIRAIALSLALGAAPAFAQGTPADPNNPHDVTAKDKPAAAAGTNADVQAGEKDNPHSTDNKNKKSMKGHAGHDKMVEKGEKESPHNAKAHKKGSGEMGTSEAGAKPAEASPH